MCQHQMFLCCGKSGNQTEFFEQVVMFKMVLEVYSNNNFQYFGEEWKICNRPVIYKYIRIKGGFFEKLPDYGSF